MSEKLNIDLRKLFVKNDGVGLERVSMLLGDSITKIEMSLVKIFEGKPLPPGKKHRNPLDRGIIPIVKEISEIDLCNVLTYVVNKTPQIVKNIPFSADKKDGSSQLADSTKKESRQKSQFERKVQDLQDKAYEAQKLIDKYYTNFSDSNNVESRIGLQNLSRNLQLVFTTTEEAQSLLTQSNRELSIAFPQLLAYNAFLENVFGFFNKFSDFSSLSSKEIDKIKSYVDKTRGVLVAIQAFDSKNPASLIGLGISALSPKIQEDLDKINKIVNPDKLLPFVKNVQSVCVNIQNSVRYVLSIVSTGQRIINTAVRIVRVLQIVKRFIYVLLVALPNMFLTVGINQAFSDGLKKIQDLLDKILKTLNQLNGILLRIIVVIEYIIAQIEEILRYVKIMILNLESCSNSDPEIVKQLKEVVTSLENSVKSLNDFKNNYQTKSSSKDNTFGDKTNKYSIRIVTEQLADEGITLKRRFGIAVDKNGVLVASSTPTFASEDSIIISEVKLILVSKKLVNPEMSELSGEGIRIINESLNFVQDDEVSINESLLDVDFSFDMNQEESLDDPNNENEDRGIGLNAFANKLPGGKKLRDRVRKRISAIIGNFSSQNPGVSVPISQNVTQGSTADTQYNKEQRIKQLQEKREELSKQRRRALLAGPAGVAIVAAKTKEIRDIDKQIEDLRK